MKVALVNLCKIEDFAQASHYTDGISFLVDNDIPYVDYMAGRNTAETLVDGFHEALKDPSVDLIWFVQGGNALIELLGYIDWDLVRTTKAVFFGLSDFTHFALKALAMGKACYYGPSLKRIKEYLPTPADRHVVSFLQTGQTPTPVMAHQQGPVLQNPEMLPVIGGHSVALAVMMGSAPLDLQHTLLFIEHHSAANESLDDAAYYLAAIMHKLASDGGLPQGILLGHPLVSDGNEGWLKPETVNAAFAAKTAPYTLPVYYNDHFNAVIKLSIK